MVLELQRNILGIFSLITMETQGTLFISIHDMASWDLNPTSLITDPVTTAEELGSKDLRTPELLCSSPKESVMVKH